MCFSWLMGNISSTNHPQRLARLFNQRFHERQGQQQHTSQVIGHLSIDTKWAETDCHANGAVLKHGYVYGNPYFPYNYRGCPPDFLFNHFWEDASLKWLNHLKTVGTTHLLSIGSVCRWLHTLKSGTFCSFTRENGNPSVSTVSIVYA